MSSGTVKSIFRIALGVLAVIALFVVLAYLYGAKTENERRTAITRADFKPVLQSLQEVWEAVPANQLPQEEMQAFVLAAHVLEDKARPLAKEQAPKKETIVAAKQAAVRAADALNALRSQVAAADAAQAQALTDLESKLRSLVIKLEPVLGRSHWTEIVQQAYKSTLAALGATIKVVADWPIATLLAIVALLFFAEKKGGIGELFKGVQQIKFGAGSAEIAFTAAEAPQVSKDAREVFKKYADEAKKVLDDLAKTYTMPNKLQNVAEKHVKQFLHDVVEADYRDKVKAAGGQPDPNELEKRQKNHWDSLRFTLHVQDIVFANGLYQLVDYYPKFQQGSGRRWSFRYGLIGRSWRLGESVVESNIKKSEEILVNQWGMTRHEVRNSVSDRESFVSAIVKSKDDQVIGILYIDSNITNVFAIPSDKAKAKVARDDLIECIITACEEHAVTQDLTKLVRRLEHRRLEISPYES